LVITNGEQGAKPAEVEQTVMALIQETVTEDETTTHNVFLYDEFVVGEEPVPIEPAFYQVDSSGEEPILTKLDKNYVDEESIGLETASSLVGEDWAVGIYVDIDINAERPFSNVSTITARTSEGNDDEGYELNVVTEPVLDKGDEPTGFYNVLVYYDGETLPDDFFTSSESGNYTNVTLSLENGATYTIKLLAYVPE